jgi:hypothetical protein
MSIMFAWARFFVKLIFSCHFSSVPSLGNDSSLNLGMPRNELFLPRNNGSHSEYIRGTFSKRNSNSVGNPNIDDMTNSRRVFSSSPPAFS